MSHKSNPQPPKHLSRESRAWWRSVVSDYELELHHLKLLQSACESLDRVAEARLLIERDGVVIEDRFGQQKPHPACDIERHNRALFARMLRELALDVEGPAETVRPPVIQGNSRLRVAAGG